MSDSYQAIYDAVRSKVTGCNVGSAVTDAVRSSFEGASYLWQHAQQEIYAVSHEMQRPSVLFRPELSMDGNQWCALYGKDLQTGVTGFGDTPAAAMAAFDQAWNTQKAVPA
ncbi:MAG TPA: hypothetical protein VI653_07310 [Steroidobacteraceae bacterium]